ncbi:MAG: hypothetical protein LUG50_04305 [Planctomycetaceae bacterium]|nr:hypothetical protein [Planctomycetaceae bacterium]
MMHAAVYRGNGQVVLEERRIPTPEDPRDAIVKVTLTSICTSDLHILHGAVPAPATEWFSAMNSSARWWRRAMDCPI